MARGTNNAGDSRKREGKLPYNIGEWPLGAPRRKGGGGKRARALLLAFVLLAAAAAGGTWAYQKFIASPVSNTFQAAKISTEIDEEFNDPYTVKKNVNVRNTGTVPAYVRVKLVTYRVDGEGEDKHRIGGTAAIPDFTPGKGWVEYPEGSNVYYYTKPVAPKKDNDLASGFPENPLIGNGDNDGITLQTYTDTDGGRQVIEVLGEAIQAAPPEAIHDAWGVTITPPDGEHSNGSVTAYTEGGTTE